MLSVVVAQAPDPFFGVAIGGELGEPRGCSAEPEVEFPQEPDLAQLASGAFDGLAADTEAEPHRPCADAGAATGA